MRADSRPDRLAVLIDADNVSSQIADGLFEEIAKLGEARVRRIYGDFSSPRLKAWADILARHAIIPQQQFAHAVGKNASDIALVIEAMDLMHGERVDGFCLVSSDSDFTRLAARIREQGLQVYGFGEQKTPDSFRQACSDFILTESLSPGIPRAPSAIPILRHAAAAMKSADGWVELAPLGKLLRELDQGFKPRTYGSTKLIDVVRNTKAFDIEGSGSRVRIRLTAVSAR